MFSFVIVLCLFYRFTILSLSVWALFRNLDQNDTFKSVIACEYIFIFPVYKEQKIIYDTLKYYEQFLAQTQNIHLLFVTTVKESDVPSTASLIRQYQKQSKWKAKISLIQCPDLNGTKATQLNFALQYIKSSRSSLPRLVCFDCDARITYENFAAAERYMEQKSSYLLFCFVPRPVLSNRLLMIKALMLHHLERILAFEWNPTDFAHYPMGATLIVLPKLWKKIDHFPEPIDDIPLAYLLRWKGVKFTSLPYFTLVQAPPDIKNAFHQIIPIFKGVFSYFSLAKKLQFQLSLWHSLSGFLSYVFFLLEYISLIVFTYLFFWQGSGLVGLLFIQILIDLHWSKMLSLQNTFLHFLGYYLRLLQFFYFLWQSIFFSRHLSQYKTER